MEQEEVVEAEILEAYQLQFSDLVMLSSSSCRIPEEEQERLESITKTVMETLGPSGPGLLTITGVPKASQLRRNLLPLAPKLSLLNNHHRQRVLKEQGLGSDVSLKNPDRNVSSFALQLKYVQNPISTSGGDSSKEHLHDPDTDGSNELMECQFGNLRHTFKELGVCMMELGLQLARVCDRAIGGNELEQSILESSMAKGRLIHYHSTLDNLLLKASEETRGKKNQANLSMVCPCDPENSEVKNRLDRTPVEESNLETHTSEARSCKTSLSNLWQQWHYDYGIFTILTTPMFISPCSHPITESNEVCCKSRQKEYLCPNGHTHLQIYDSNKNKILVVRSPPDSFIIQVGESADIITHGKLRSTLHSVSRPVTLKNLSRENFVVFLQPAWGKAFSVSDHHHETSTLNGHCSDIKLHSGLTLHHPEQPPKIYKQIQDLVPPLSSRLKDGMTFAEFSRETTKQYYGSNGTIHLCSNLNNARSANNNNELQKSYIIWSSETVIRRSSLTG